MDGYVEVKPTLKSVLDENSDSRINWEDAIIINFQDCSGEIPDGVYPAEEYYKLKLEADKRREEKMRT